MDPDRKQRPADLQFDTEGPYLTGDENFLRRHPSALLLFLILVIVTSLIFWIYGLDKNRLERRYQQQLSAADAQIIRIATGLIGKIQRASLTLDRELLLSGMLSLKHSFDREDVETLFRSYIQDQPYISQIRWLDAGGMERARIERHSKKDGNYEFLAAETLQDKSHREYFMEASKLKPGEFYNSYMSLNREFGRITVPPQPVIRTATKTHSALGMLEGVLFINFDLSQAIAEYHNAARLTGVSVDMLDAVSGHVYVSTEHPDLKFSHELKVSPETLWDRVPERRTRHIEFMASGKQSQKSQRESLYRGSTIDTVGTSDAVERKHRSGPGVAATKSQFLANMSHEIRTPGTGIIGMLDLIETGSESPENVKRIKFVKRSTNSLRQIIDDILTRAGERHRQR